MSDTEGSGIITDETIPAGSAAMLFMPNGDINLAIPGEHSGGEKIPWHVMSAIIGMRLFHKDNTAMVDVLTEQVEEEFRKLTGTVKH